MKKLVLFYAHSGDDEKDWNTLIRASDGTQQQVRFLGQHTGSKPAPEPGYRLSETKRDVATAKVYHLDDSDTHYRPGPWVVDSVESYLPDLPIGTEFTEIVVCQCEYSPLPDADNPWKEYNAPVVHPDAFGGDTEAFEAFKQSEQAQKVTVIDPVTAE